MAKKLVSVWLSLTVLIFSSISIYAEQNVRGDFFTKNIVINGETIDNNHLQFPFCIYEDSTYFPLTPEMCEILGLKAELHAESRTLKLLKTEPTLTNISDKRKKNERKDLLLELVEDVQVLVYEPEPRAFAQILKEAGILKDKSADAETEATAEADETDSKANANAGAEDGKDADQTTKRPKIGDLYDEIIEIPKLTVREIDLEGLPVLAKGSILYLPVRALTGEAGLGWDVYFDPYTGIYISTKEGIPANSYWDRVQSEYNRGLVNYIMRHNKNYTENKAQELLFMFLNAAKTYKIDEKILIAVAHKESTFNPKCRSSSGALGIMQIMPSTGARYGLETAQLLDPEISINFGAMYLSERIAAYNGDLIKGFSAYNQGSVKVNRGTHSTRYASKVIDTMNGIDRFLSSNGFRQEN